MFIMRLQTYITFRVHELIKQNIRLLIWIGALTGYYPVGCGNAKQYSGNWPYSAKYQDKALITKLNV